MRNVRLNDPPRWCIVQPETGNVVTTWKTGKRILKKYEGGD